MNILILSDEYYGLRDYGDGGGSGDGFGAGYGNGDGSVTLNEK